MSSPLAPHVTFVCFLVPCSLAWYSPGPPQVFSSSLPSDVPRERQEGHPQDQVPTPNVLELSPLDLVLSSPPMDSRSFATRCLFLLLLVWPCGWAGPGPAHALYSPLLAMRRWVRALIVPSQGLCAKRILTREAAGYPSYKPILRFCFDSMQVKFTTHNLYMFLRRLLDCCEVIPGE